MQKKPKPNNPINFRRKCKVFINTVTQSIFIWQPLIITTNIQDFVSVDFKLLNPGLYIKIVFLSAFLLVMQYVQASSSYVFHTTSNFWAICWQQDPLFEKKNPSTFHLTCTHAVGTLMKRAHLSNSWLSQMFLYGNNEQTEIHLALSTSKTTKSTSTYLKISVLIHDLL